MKYIDAEKLIAEIERLQQEVRNKWKENPRSSIDDGFLTACSRFLDIITSLQQEQPEVDLEKDAVSYCYDNGINISPRQAKGIASHFYELGKKVK